MSSTVDADVLLYASDEASPFHARAVGFLEELARGPRLFYLFWPTVMAYLRIATHPGVFAAPLPPPTRSPTSRGCSASPTSRRPASRDRFWEVYADVATSAGASGNLVPDAHLVALMRENGVRLIWTSDRDFRRFDGIQVRDPFA